MAQWGETIFSTAVDQCYHTTISVELGVSSEFEVLKLKTCLLYQDMYFDLIKVVRTY